MESLNETLARKTVKRYACSSCWGELEMTPDLRANGMFFVICKRCRDETKGYVTQYYVNRRRGESEFEQRDVVRLLQKIDIIPDPLKGKTRDDLLKELGF